MTQNTRHSERVSVLPPDLLAISDGNPGWGRPFLLLAACLLVACYDPGAMVPSRRPDASTSETDVASDDSVSDGGTTDVTSSSEATGDSEATTDEPDVCPPGVFERHAFDEACLQ